MELPRNQRRSEEAQGKRREGKASATTRQPKSAAWFASSAKRGYRFIRHKKKIFFSFSFFFLPFLTKDSYGDHKPFFFFCFSFLFFIKKKGRKNSFCCMYEFLKNLVFGNIPTTYMDESCCSQYI
jgi:hypothetical protein